MGHSKQNLPSSEDLELGCSGTLDSGDPTTTGLMNNMFQAMPSTAMFNNETGDPGNEGKLRSKSVKDNKLEQQPGKEEKAPKDKKEKKEKNPTDEKIKAFKADLQKLLLVKIELGNCEFGASDIMTALTICQGHLETAFKEPENYEDGENFKLWIARGKSKVDADNAAKRKATASATDGAPAKKRRS